MAKWAETETVTAPDMPDRIFADPPEIFDGSDIWRTEPGGRATEYVRADLYREATMDALASSGQAQDALAELAALRERAEKLADALRELIEAYSNPDALICCNGYQCGCRGATRRDLAEHDASAALAEWEAGK